MAGFKVRISRVGSDRCNNWATTTALTTQSFIIFSLKGQLQGGLLSAPPSVAFDFDKDHKSQLGFVLKSQFFVWHENRTWQRSNNSGIFRLQLFLKGTKCKKLVNKKSWNIFWQNLNEPYFWSTSFPGIGYSFRILFQKMCSVCDFEVSFFTQKNLLCVFLPFCR